MEETKEFICHGGYGDADNGKEQPCSAGPCTAIVKSNFDPCYCLLFGDDGLHIPDWEESCDGKVVVEDTSEVEREQVSSDASEPSYTTTDILREANAVDSIIKELSRDATMAQVYQRIMNRLHFNTLAAWVAKQLGK